jgi:2,4-dienoyl-CoA reductase (NADPH2)
MRAQHKGIVQSTDLVPMGMELDDNGAATVNLLHHPTGAMQPRTVDWVVLAVPPAPLDGLYHELRAAGMAVQRVGDCIAPRRAHAAVVDGERAGNAC